MAENQNRQPTAEESALENLKDEDYLNALAVNSLTDGAGILGEDGRDVGNRQYTDALYSDKANQTRKELANQEYQKNQELGVAGRPSISDTQVSRNMLEILNASVGQVSDLGKLEKVVQKTAPGFKMSVPDELKEKLDELNTYRKQLEDKAKKAKESGDENSFNEAYKQLQATQKDNSELLQIEGKYRTMAYEALRKGSSLKLYSEHAYDEMNGGLEKMGEAYLQKYGEQQNK